MTSVFSKRYSRLLFQYHESFSRLFNGSHPAPEAIACFETALEHEQLYLKEQLSIKVTDNFDLWGGAGLILEEAIKHCPSSTNQGLPSISQKYLELVHQFVLLREALYVRAATAVEGHSTTNQAAQAILKMLRTEEINSDNSGKDKKGADKAVYIVNNIRNAFAHGKAWVEIDGIGNEQGPASLIYDGSQDEYGPNIKRRPIEDVALLGALMQEFTLSVIRASGVIVSDE